MDKTSEEFGETESAKNICNYAMNSAFAELSSEDRNKLDDRGTDELSAIALCLEINKKSVPFDGLLDMPALHRTLKTLDVSKPTDKLFRKDGQLNDGAESDEDIYPGEEIVRIVDVTGESEDTVPVDEQNASEVVSFDEQHASENILQFDEQHVSEDILQFDDEQHEPEDVESVDKEYEQEDSICTGSFSGPASRELSFEEESITLFDIQERSLPKVKAKSEAVFGHPLQRKESRIFKLLVALRIRKRTYSEADQLHHQPIFVNEEIQRDARLAGPEAPLKENMVPNSKLTTSSKPEKLPQMSDVQTHHTNQIPERSFQDRLKGLFCCVS